jgi:hypothetical protein
MLNNGDREECAAEEERNKTKKTEDARAES